MSDFFTGRGDDGTTSLLGDQRVPKYDKRPEAYGCVDEASAALGLARSMAIDEHTDRVTAQVQRDLYGLMAEVAATPENVDRFQTIDEARVEWLEEQIGLMGHRVVMPKDFVISGDTQSGAAYDLARTVVRRAERRISRLLAEEVVTNRQLVRYLNRLSSLCFVLSLWENVQSGIDRPSLARGPGS